MKIALGSDHGGFKYKNEIRLHLLKQGYEVIDCGTFNEESCDYPVYAFAAAEKVAHHEADFGVLVCTTGEGIMMAANKVKGIRCAMGYADEVCVLCREHNNANMIAFGQKFMELKDVLKRVDLFLNTNFIGDRHAKRVQLIDDYHEE